MKDRGIVKPGLIADLAVFDPDKLKDAATLMTLISTAKESNMS